MLTHRITALLAGVALATGLMSTATVASASATSSHCKVKVTALKADLDAVARQVGIARRDGTVIELDMAQPDGEVIEALVRLVAPRPQRIESSRPGKRASRSSRRRVIVRCRPSGSLRTRPASRSVLRWWLKVDFGALGSTD